MKDFTAPTPRNPRNPRNPIATIEIDDIAPGDRTVTGGTVTARSALTGPDEHGLTYLPVEVEYSHPDGEGGTPVDGQHYWIAYDDDTPQTIEVTNRIRVMTSDLRDGDTILRDGREWRVDAVGAAQQVNTLADATGDGREVTLIHIPVTLRALDTDEVREGHLPTKTALPNAEGTEIEIAMQESVLRGDPTTDHRHIGWDAPRADGAAPTEGTKRARFEPDYTPVNGVRIWSKHLRANEGGVAEVTFRGALQGMPWADTTTRGRLKVFGEVAVGEGTTTLRVAMVPTGKRVPAGGTRIGSAGSMHAYLIGTHYDLADAPAAGQEQGSQG